MAAEQNHATKGKFPKIIHNQTPRCLEVKKRDNKNNSLFISPFGQRIIEDKNEWDEYDYKTLLQRNEIREQEEKEAEEARLSQALTIILYLGFFSLILIPVLTTSFPQIPAYALWIVVAVIFLGILVWASGRPGLIIK